MYMEKIGKYEEVYDRELEQLTLVECMLENSKFPIKKKHNNNQDRKNVFYGDEEITAMCLGLVKNYWYAESLYPAANNRKHPELLEALRELIKLHNPDFEYTSIQVNKNTKTNWHYDKNNSGLSYCIGIGEGGIMFENDIFVENDRKWFKYDGKNNKHKTIQNGECRYAIIYFTRLNR